jgi:hypothetical protein
MRPVACPAALLWTNDGVPVCTAAYHQYVPRIASDGFGDAIVTREDGRSAVDYDVFAQLILSNGVVGQWPFRGAVVLTPDGAQICGAHNDQGTPQIAEDGAGGAMITWLDNRNGSTTPDIYAQSVYLGPVATQLRSYAARFSGSGVQVEWSVSEIAADVGFVPMRASGADDDFLELSPTLIEREELSFSFVDENCEPGTTYRYRVDIVESGERRVLFESDAVTTPPGMLTLHQNSSNPFNPSTVITYDIPAGCKVELSVYDVTGKLVWRTAEGYRDGGSHSCRWDGRDMTGAQVASGVYVYRLFAGKEVASRKMVLLR